MTCDTYVTVVLGDDWALVVADLTEKVVGDPREYFVYVLNTCDLWGIGTLCVSRELADKLIAHGTRDQYFANGYDGHSALLREVPDQMADESLWITSEDGV